MSSHVYTQHSKEKIALNPKPFASGGEGSLYKIVSPQNWTNHVVKLYHPEKLNLTREQKINYLLQHTPQHTAKDSVVWVKDIIKDKQGNFIGFVMPFVKGEKLEILCSTKLPRKLENTWFRFHPEAKEALDLRLKLCYNLAVAIHQVHSCGRYVLVDLKPDNVIVTPEGLVSLVDMDSVEVVENGRKLFDAPVATPEYTPPEKYKRNEMDPTQQQSWDCFSMAVIFYKLLIQIHPFAGSFKKPYDTVTTLSEMIEKGLFVHNKELKPHHQAIPPIHQNFFKLSKELQQLFIDCFVQGHESPAVRPSANEWCSVMMQYLDLNQNRTVVSSLIKRPIAVELLTNLQNLPSSPENYLSKIKTTNNTIVSKELTIQKDADKRMLKIIQKINLLLLVFGLAVAWISVFFENYFAVGMMVFCFTILLSILINVVSFARKSEKKYLFLLDKRVEKEWLLFQQQQTILEGIQKHLETFFERLKIEHHKLFQKGITSTSHNTNQQVEFVLAQLESELELIDKEGQQLAASETFEYGVLKDKYLRLLHTNPLFANAVSLTAEFAGIDFAVQEKMEYLQKNSDRELKNTKESFQKQYDVEQLKIQKLNKEADSKIKAYQVKSELAEKQEIKKILLQTQRQLIGQNADIAKNKDMLLTLFKDEIVALLSKYQVYNMTDIKEIDRSGKITLENGITFSIAPLRYYQIHELIEWWSAVKIGKVELSPELKTQIKLRYETDYKNYKTSMEKRLKELCTSINKVKKTIKNEWTLVMNELREKEQKPILELKKSYALQKEFLEQLIIKQQAEEQEIHLRYEEKFEQLKKKAQAKSDKTTIQIQQLTKSNLEDNQKMSLYQANLKKYEIGLLRLEEELRRLENIETRYKGILLLDEYYKRINLSNHVAEVFYLKNNKV